MPPYWPTYYEKPLRKEKRVWLSNMSTSSADSKITYLTISNSISACQEQAMLKKKKKKSLKYRYVTGYIAIEVRYTNSLYIKDC